MTPHPASIIAYTPTLCNRRSRRNHTNNHSAYTLYNSSITIIWMMTRILTYGPSVIMQFRLFKILIINYKLIN